MPSYGDTFIPRLLPRVPTIQLPFSAPTINVPLLSCFSGDGRSYVGRHFANRPDLLKLQHLKQQIAQFEERIITQTIGKLDNPARSAGFAAQIAEITAKITDATQSITETVGDVTEEIDASLQLVNARIEELNALRDELNAVPINMRSKVTTRMMARYEEYFGELEAQVSNLQSARSCVMSFLS
jgi:hypothetical protein